MANWANISRNAKTHGDFAGRSKAEQDAYFEFFAGSEPSTLKSIFVSFRRVFDKVVNRPLFAGDPEVRILGYGKEQMWKQILT